MSEQEIKDQIDRDIEKLCPMDHDMPDHIKEEITFSYNFGVAIAEGQDKIATNRTVEAALKLLDSRIDRFMNNWNMKSAAALQEVRQELEKLRR